MNNKSIDWAVDVFVNFNYGNVIKKKVNDMVYQNGDCIVWNFHGNTIAKANTTDNTIMVTLNGWAAKSTMERLNALLQALGVKGHPFRGYGTTRHSSKPTFCGTPISDTEEIVIKLEDIPTGAYNYE